MTPEQLEMLKKLKAPIDKYMGEWEVGDKALYGKFECMLTQIKRKEKYLYFRFDDEQNFLSKDDESFVNEHFLRIPPLCTPDGKRCLWGMVDWNKFHIEFHHGTMDIYIDGEVLCVEADPETALLKALCEQEGV